MTSIECNHKQVDSARKGQEVCVKIENVPGETPKLYGRHFDETDMLISKVSVVVNLVGGVELINNNCLFMLLLVSLHRVGYEL